LLLLLFRADSASFVSSTSLIFWPFVYILDFVSYIWLCVALLFYTISNKAQISISTIFFDNLTNKVTFSGTSQASTKVKSTYSLPTALTVNNLDKNWVNLVHNLYKSKLILDQSTSIPLTEPMSSTSLKIDNSMLSIFLDSNKNNYNNVLPNPKFSFIINSKYSSKASSLLDNTIFNNAADLSKVSSNNILLNNEYNNSIEQNLLLANQSRWAFKTSPITEKLVRDNFNYTQSKNLLGSSFTNSLSSSNNIWNSNNLTNLKEKSNLLLSNNLTNLNYFEDSRAWSMKKAYLGLNTTEYLLSYDLNKSHSSLISTKKDTLVSAYLLDYSLSYSNMSLFSNNLTLQHNAALNSTIFNSDNTIYQDSYNNYLFNLSTTTITSNFNTYKYNSVKVNSFTFISTK
jgi:hypothetical protein